MSKLGRILLAASLSTLALSHVVAPASAAKPTLVYAKVSADGDPSHMATRYGKLIKALGDAIAQPVMFQTRRSYEEISKAMGKGLFTVVSAGPAIYLAHEDQYEPIARPIRRGKSFYRGIFLVAKDSPARTLADLRGKRLGFANKQSTSGYLLPALMLGEAGVDLDKEPSERITIFKGDHTEVVRAVTEGRIDAGAVYDDARVATYGGNMTARERTRILVTTPEIPNAPIMVPKDLSPELKERITRFFVTCTERPDAKELLGALDEKASGWVPTSSKDYDVVRRYRSAFQQADQ